MAARASFQWDDPLLLDQQLTDDERQVRDAARAYSQDRLMPRVLERPQAVPGKVAQNGDRERGDVG